VWSLQYTGFIFTGGPIFYVNLNGRPFGMSVATQGGFPPQWGPVPSTYWLEINHGGNIYVYPNGDIGVCAATAYGAFIPNNVTTSPPCPCTLTGPGIALPNYNGPPFGPSYTPSSDGSSITSPTISTLTTIDGIWSLQGTNATYGGANIFLNGVGFGDNRGGGNTDTGPGTFMGATTLKVANHGQLYALLPDATWRCMAGLQGNPVPGGDPGSSSLPVPINLTCTPSGSSGYPALPYTSPTNTLVGNLTVTTSDGSTSTPTLSEISVGVQDSNPTALMYATPGPSLYTVGTQAMGTATPENVIVTRNGTSFALSLTVFYF
jgi:hypothetical protein